MTGLLRMFANGSRLPRFAGAAAPAKRPAVLAITADLRFYSGILTAADSCGWSVEWARTVSRGLEVCRSRPCLIVIYDRDLPGSGWSCALESLHAAAFHVRILLAASRVDEDLWKMVLRRRGYDILAKSADFVQLSRELRFAWLSLRNSAALPAPWQDDAVLARGFRERGAA